MLRSSEIEAITKWHWSMATIFEFICYHVHVARWLRKWPKWAIGSTSAADSGAWHVRTTWISDDIGTCPEKKVWNSVSGKYRTSLHLVKAHLHYIQDLDPSPSSDAIKTSELMLRVYTDPSPCPRFLSRMSASKLVPTCSDFLGRRHPSSSAHVVATADNQNGYDLGSEPRM